MKFFLKLLILFSFMSHAQGQDLKILSWNVFMLPKPLKFSNQKQRTKAIASALKNTDYDYIILQEAFTKSFHKEVGGSVVKDYPHQYYFKRKNFFSIYGSGVYILSRHPFKVVDSLYFRSCKDMDCFATKGAVLIESTLPSGKTIQLVGTHLQSKESAGETRLAQLREIKTLMDAHRRPDVPQFLIGDLNIDVTEPEYDKGLDLLNMKSAFHAGDIQHTNVLECYRDAESEKEWIDHIWITQETELREDSLEVRPIFYDNGEKGPCVASDHYPVEGKFSF